jgi:hypothetical protein
LDEQRWPAKMIVGTHKTISSDTGTPESREQAIVRAIDELAGTHTWSWVTFESDGSDGVIEVALDDRLFTLNIPHAEREGLIT